MKQGELRGPYTSLEAARAVCGTWKDSDPEWFCPLISKLCDNKCWCYVYPYPRSVGKEGFYALAGYCSNAMFSGERGE